MSHRFDIPSHESLQPSREQSETSSEHQTTETSEQSNANDSRAGSPHPTEDSKPEPPNKDADAPVPDDQNGNMKKETPDAGNSANLLTPLQQADSESQTLKRKDSRASANVDEFHDAQG